MGPTVRAKFQVSDKRTNGAGGGTVILSAVYEENGVNKDWAKYTPSGRLEMFIDNPAFDAFVSGGYYFLDFTPTTRE